MANLPQKVWVKLSDYEKQRMATIEENRARMREMGLFKLKDSLDDSLARKKMKSSVEKHKEKPKRKKVSIQEVEELTSFRDGEQNDYSSEGENAISEEELTPIGRCTTRKTGGEMYLPSRTTQVAALSQSPLRDVSEWPEENVEPFQSEMPEGTTTKTKGKQGKRGPTKLTWLFGSKTVLKLEWNENDLVVGPGRNAVTFTDAIGVLLKRCPHVQWAVEWPQVDSDAKKWIWNELVQHFELDMSRKDKVMQVYGGSAFRNKKKQWKKQYYIPNKTKNPLFHKPEELSEARWADLIQFWETEEQQEIARQNKINKDKSEVKQTTGRKSFARIVHEMEIEDGVRPSRGKLFEVTHTSKRTSDALDNVSRNYISKMRALAGTDEQGTPLPLTDEHYYQVMPPERHRRVRGQGPGISPTSFVDMEERIQDEVKRRVHDMTNEIESRLKAQMMEQMQSMMKQFHSDMIGSGRNLCNETTFSSQVPYSQLYHERNVVNKCRLMNWQMKVVAEGRLESKDPNALVHHIPLGPDTWKVWVDVAVDPKASLWRMTSEMSTIEDAVGTTVAWHKDYISLD